MSAITEHLEGIGTTPEPEWFAKTEEEKVRHQYWTCQGKQTEAPKRRWWQRTKVVPSRIPKYRCVFHSADDAEAHAAATSGKQDWIWDGEPARPVTLQFMMRFVRRVGDLGVCCEGWQNGRWETLKRWPAGQPLPSEESR